MIKRKVKYSVVEIKPTVEVVLVPPCLVDYFDDGWRVSIYVGKGSKFIKIITMSSKSIKITKLRVDELKDLRCPSLSTINVREAATKFLEVGQRVGMTKTAEEALREIEYKENNDGYDQAKKN